MRLLSTDPSKGLETMRDDIRSLGEKIWKKEPFIVQDILNKAEMIRDICHLYHAATILLSDEWNFPLKEYQGKRLKAEKWVRVMGGKTWTEGCILRLPVDGTTEAFGFSDWAFYDSDAAEYADGVSRQINKRHRAERTIHSAMWILMAEHIDEWLKSL